jgi:hypothetical protein
MLRDLDAMVDSVPVFLIINALWRQLDYLSKILMPWKELQSGPASADKTLLLDYLSPIIPVSLWVALKNKHWAVVVLSSGQLLITLAVRDPGFASE